MGVGMPRSYAQKVKKVIGYMYRHQAQSKKEGNYLQDLIIARAKLEDYYQVLQWLNKNGYRVVNGGEVLKRDEPQFANENPRNISKEKGQLNKQPPQNY